MLERVVLIGRAQLDSALLGALGERRVDILLLGARHSRRRGYLVGPGHNDVRRRLGQYRLWYDDALRLDWSERLLTAKVKAQHRLLESILQNRPDKRHALTGALRTLAGIRSELASACDAAALLGHEGAAAAAYYRGLTAVFAPSLGFDGRNRRPPRDPVNAALSFGYTLLHHEAVRACHLAGLDPLIGFYHVPAYGRESLACDLIEPLRPHIDEWIYSLFRGRALRADQFTVEPQGCRLGKTGRQIFFASYETASEAWRRYLRRHTNQLSTAILGLAPALPTEMP